MTLLATQQLRVSIGGRLVCRDLDFSVQPGECWALLGANGAGKTTLLHTLAGLRDADAGNIYLNARELGEWSPRELARSRGVLFQDSQDTFPATVMETVLTGRHPYLNFWQFESGHDYDIAAAALAQVELQDMAERRVDTLSGGERRRLALATLLTQNPAVHLLDEPSNHLDLHHQIHLLGHLRERVTGAGGALVMALHDVNLAARFCDHAVLIFSDGEIRQGSADELLQPGHLSCLYHHPIRAIETDGQRFFLPA